MKQAFDAFLDESYDFLTKNQGIFGEKYKPNYYENWYYEDGTGIFKLNTNEEEIYFKYQVVGSYSKNSNTWKWSWDNEYLPAVVKKDIVKIKAFGQENNYEKLSSGTWDAAEIDGWRMAAIASQLLKPIGVYQISSDDLSTYLILTESLTKEEVTEIEKFHVHCGSHGKRRRAFVCKHLKEKNKIGFHENFLSTEDELLPIGYDYDHQAWCDECEKVRLETDGWNDDSMAFADIRVICKSCYFEIKRINN